ncbi:MAG: hypothetical protein U1E10_15055, partial [Bdellovibrionales bacterium]|nr:hypothetical protein [Bdellovibrionales bacterium]
MKNDSFVSKTFSVFLSISLAIIPLLSTSTAFSLERLSPDLLLKMADDVRNPSEVYKMKIGVKTSSTDQVFEVFLKGKDKTLVIVKSPAKDRGRNMLMLDRDFHAYIPNLKKSVR